MRYFTAILIFGVAGLMIYLQYRRAKSWSDSNDKKNELQTLFPDDKK
jgi:hypothetical protein